MKAYIQEISYNSFNAGFKARHDCDQILENSGYVPFFLPKRRGVRYLKWVYNLYDKLILPKQIRRYESCFVQYPYYSLGYNANIYKWLFKGYSGRVECLIHDIIGYREGKEIEKPLKDLLRRCDKIIVHTPSMADKLIQDLGLSPEKLKVLYLFDYLTAKEPRQINLNENSIVFAGNLKKSLFISQMDKLSEALSFNLYGSFSENVKETKRCFYKGKFSPNDISDIEGTWGLAWDGDKLETCHGPMGDYLKINSSHKISLYLASCKPVVLWRESSLAEFIVSNKLGIVVSSLYELFDKLSGLTEQEKQDMERSVKAMSLRLRNGDMLRGCL